MKLKRWGAVSLKQYQQPRRDQRQWVMDAARKHGLQVTSENGDLEYTLGMIMDGHTGFEHPMSYTPLYSDVTTFFGKAQATYSPTFMVGGPGPWNEEYWYQESEVWKDPKTRRFMPWVQLRAADPPPHDASGHRLLASRGSPRAWPTSLRLADSAPSARTASTTDSARTGRRG